MKPKWPPEELVNSIVAIDKGSAERAAVLVGAGLSQVAGYVSWAELRKELLKLCLVNSDQQLRRELREVNDPLLLASWCRNTKKQEYYRLLKRLFQHDHGKRLYTSVHKTLLGIGFFTILTTNYDSCLENCAKAMKSARNSYYYKDQIDHTVVFNERGCICHLHGYAVAAHEQIVLTFEDYFEAYRNPFLVETIKSSLFYKTMLFVGFSFDDPAWRQMLEQLALGFRDSAGVSHGARHFALLPASEHESTQVREWFLSERYNISAEFYRVRKVRGRLDYSDLNRKLKYLSDAVELARKA